MALDGCPCFNLGRAHRRVARVFEVALEPLGLTVAQAHCLHALFSRDGRPAKELARELQIDAGTLTPMLDRLERSGLVRRCPDPGDRRATRICLEERAHRLRPAVEAALESASARLAARLAPAEFVTLMRLLRRLVDEGPTWQEAAPERSSR
ncbi:MAG: MarR family transcriptional regulator [Candidatus Sericytochromatia bacterium]|nr:MarR family transcriptional regulator [Candidatus Sericytochromatia bacterium]